MADIKRLDCSYTFAPAPNDRTSLIELPISPDRIRALAKHGKRVKLFEVFYNVMGIVPPVNNVGYWEDRAGILFPDHWGGLRHADALFQGLKRPMTEDGYDGKVYIYIIRPRFQYEYIPDMVCVAKRVDAPKKAVFAVYVLLEPQPMIINWEWVIADSVDPSLPKNHADRYERRIW